MSEFDDLLDHVESELAWFGEKRRAATEAEFDYEEFLDAAKLAYGDREWAPLQRIDGIDTYAQSLCLAVAKYEGWEGGDAEPVPIEVKTGDEVLDELTDP